MLDWICYKLSDQSQLHWLVILQGKSFHTWAKYTEWLTNTVKQLLPCQKVILLEGKLKKLRHVAPMKGWKWQCLETVQKTRGWEMSLKHGVRWKIREGKREKMKKKIDKDTDKKDFNSKLCKSVRPCVCVCVYTHMHLPVGAGWATPPCLMSLWRQSHVCRALMQTGWSEYLFNFGSPLRENGALHKHRLQSNFAHS